MPLLNNWLNHIVNSNLEGIDDEWEQRGLRIINTLILCLFLLMTIFFSLSFVIGMPEARPAILVAIAVTLLHFWVSRHVPLKAVKLYAAIIPALLVLYISIFIIGKEGNDKYFFINTLILPMLFFREAKWYLPLASISILFFFVTSYCQTIIEPWANLPSDSMLLYTMVNGFAIGVLAIITIKTFKIEIFGYQNTIYFQKQSLEEKNKEITESIHYAKGIQEAILPSTDLLERDFKEGFVCYLPKDIVAGDFYWMEKVEDKIYFAAADCTGHGVPGAMVSVVCSNALQQTLFEYKITEVDRILESTSNLVSATFAKSPREIKDGMDIGLCCWNTKTRELTFSGANNPLWVISEKETLETSSACRTTSENGKYLHEIKGTKRPVGNSFVTISFEKHSLKLSKGDEVILQTDGFADQFGGPKGKKYKYSSLKSFLLNSSDDSRKVDLTKEITEWRGNYEQLDDICIVGYKVN